MTGKPFDMCIMVLFDKQMTETDLLDTPAAALLEYGVSNELVSLLAAIEEATCLDGSPRYTQASIYELRRKLLCYNYGTAYYEVAHLLAIVTHFGGGIDETFWVEEAVQADRFRHLTENWAAHDALTAGSTLAINLNGRQFDFNWRRANMMAAWTEFLLFILQPGLHPLLAPFEDTISGKQIDQLASELQKQTYSFLKVHLQPQNQLRECWQFLKWLKNGEADGEADDKADGEADGEAADKADDKTASGDYLQLLNDEKVLAFWRQNADGAPGDHRRFVSVGELAYDVVRSVTTGWQRWQLDHAASHNMTGDEGDDWIRAMGNGEFTPDEEAVELFRLCDAEVDATITATEQLISDELASIKCLTATDILAAKQLERPAHELNRLPQTHIRMQLFGKHQASITGDLQNHQGKNLPGLLACESVRTPAIWIEEMKRLVTKINETRSAIAHILIEADEPAALQIAEQQIAAPQIAEQQIAEQQIAAPQIAEQQIAALQIAALQIIVDLNPGNAFFGPADEVSLTHLPEDVRERCAASYKSINRQGFKAYPEPDFLPVYVLADQQLSRLAQGFATLAPMITSYQHHFDSDRATFSTTFRKLYEAVA